MSYRLALKELLTKDIKRVATEQVDNARAALIAPNTELGSATHTARKCFKKLRAVLRLVRDEIGEEVYQRENICYRDAGRQLSTLRESQVAIQTFDKLTEPDINPLNKEGVEDIRKRLKDRHQQIRQEYLDEDRLEHVAYFIEPAREQIAYWPMEHDDFSAFYGGLKRVYKRGYKAMTTAYDSLNPNDFHEWRKRVKYLWYHLRLLKNCWPRVIGEMADSIHDLSDYLGAHHDLADFRHMLEDRPEIIKDAELQMDLLTLIDRKRAEYEADAFPLGWRIYAEEPKAFTNRIAAYWKSKQLDKEHVEQKQADELLRQLHEIMS